MDPEPIPDIEAILPPPPVEAGWTIWQMLALAAVVLVVAGLVARVIRWMMRRSKIRPVLAVEKSPREVALDVLHQLKEGHVEMPAHALASQAHPAFWGYVRQRWWDGTREATSEVVERSRSLLVECDEMRFSRTPEADSRRLPLIEAMLEFVREDPFPVKNDEPAPHTAAA